MWHGAMAGNTANFNLNLHTTTLGAINSKTRACAISSTLGDYDQVWNWELMLLNHLILEVVERATAVIVLLLDGGNGYYLDVLQTAIWDQL